MIIFMEQALVVFITIVVLTFFSIAIYRLIIRHDVLAYQEHGATCTKPITEILSTLDQLVEIEFNFKVTLPFSGKEIQRVTNFEATIEDISQACMAKVDPTIYVALRVNGINDTFVASYISRLVMLRLIDFMRETNTGIKKDPDLEYEDSEPL